MPEIVASPIRFPEQTEELANAASKLKSSDLKKLMHISDALADLNAERYAAFFDQPERPAIYAFCGDVYIGFDVPTLPEESLAFAQDHVRILSGLYGLLRPLDAIRPYRLEMGTRWAAGVKNLYGYWGDRIGGLVAEDLEELGSSVLVNLASKEYWQAAKDHIPSHISVIDIDFREVGPNGLRFNSFAAKRARGMMARYICEYHLTDPESLKDFDNDGYAFDRGGSSPQNWRFTRG